MKESTVVPISPDTSLHPVSHHVLQYAHHPYAFLSTNVFPSSGSSACTRSMFVLPHPVISYDTVTQACTANVNFDCIKYIGGGSTKLMVSDWKCVTNYGRRYSSLIRNTHGIVDPSGGN